MVGGVEDGILEYCFFNLMLCACGGWSAEAKYEIFKFVVIPNISRIDIKAASSQDETSTPAVGLPRPRQTHRVIVIVLSALSTSCSRIDSRFLKHDDSLHFGV